ncbi:MAG: hypothetical protein K5986_01700, partial [Clostridium sp.]|nr:hypothetical protein [Clostridium sp.]
MLSLESIRTFSNKKYREYMSISNLVYSISVDINRQGCGNYISKVINAINIAESRKDIKLFQEVLKKMKSTSFGGNNQKEGFRIFVDEIIKNPRYKINSLNFEELQFVFQWVRRLVKTKSDKKNTTRNTGSNFSVRDNYGYKSNTKSKGSSNKGNNVYKDNDIDDNPFAILT